MKKKKTPPLKPCPAGTHYRSQFIPCHLFKGHGGKTHLNLDTGTEWSDANQTAQPFHYPDLGGPKHDPRP